MAEEDNSLHYRMPAERSAQRDSLFEEPVFTEQEERDISEKARLSESSWLPGVRLTRTGIHILNDRGYGIVEPVHGSCDA